jgi:hypothetical protein
MAHVIAGFATLGDDTGLVFKGVTALINIESDGKPSYVNMSLVKIHTLAMSNGVLPAISEELDCCRCKAPCDWDYRNAVKSFCLACKDSNLGSGDYESIRISQQILPTLHGTTADTAEFHINIEHLLQSLSPGHRYMVLRWRFLILTSCHFLAALAPLRWHHPHPMFAVRSKYTVKPCQVDSGLGDQGSQFGDEIHRLEDHVGRAITIWGFQLISDRRFSEMAGRVMYRHNRSSLSR